MLTDTQKKWVEHLPTDSKIKIVPWDPTAEEKFEKIKSIIQSSMGQTVSVEHHGATALGISGQDAIDVYVPVEEKMFNTFLKPMTELFGEPKSHYVLERARFVTIEAGKHVDIFLVNKIHSSWLHSIQFEKYLKKHSEELLRYEALKEAGNGLSTREYYERKIEYINSVLTKLHD